MSKMPSAASDLELLEGVALAPRASMRIGGAARFFVLGETERQVCEAVRWADRHGVLLSILGGGSNVVISDAGVDGLVLAIGLLGRRVQAIPDGIELRVAAGEPWDELVRWSVENGWAGFECLSGIPGLVGATPIQNVGAYGQEVSETVRSVRAFDREQDEIVELDAGACRFGYRDSLFKSVEPGRYVVLEVHFSLRRGAPPTLRYPDLLRELERRGVKEPTLVDVRQSVLAVRRSKSMVLDAGDPNSRSCGSFFVNPIVGQTQASEVGRRANDPTMPRYAQPDGAVKLSAAWLIERAGFKKGERYGGAGISSRHSLALVCHDGARADEVVTLARKIRTRVEDCFGVRLVPEPVFWGFSSLDGGLPDERIA
jgi:UDP-N-acetylmuramate dehydrogenase